MSNVKKWQDAKLDLNRAIEWAGNNGKIDSQSGNRYSTVVRIRAETMQFCGQAYAGESNYHSPYEAMRRALERSIKFNFMQIVDDAINIMKEDCDKLAIEAKEEVQKQLEEIEGVESNENNRQAAD